MHKALQEDHLTSRRLRQGTGAKLRKKTGLAEGAASLTRASQAAQGHDRPGPRSATSLPRHPPGLGWCFPPLSAVRSQGKKTFLLSFPQIVLGCPKSGFQRRRECLSGALPHRPSKSQLRLLPFVLGIKPRRRVSAFPPRSPAGPTGPQPEEAEGLLDEQGGRQGGRGAL